MKEISMRKMPDLLKLWLLICWRKIKVPIGGGK